MRPRRVLSVLALALGCELALVLFLVRPRAPEGMALLSGIVRDPLGAPIRAGIVLLPTDGAGPACVSDEDGRFALWFPAGKLRLVASASRWCESEPLELVLAQGERADLALSLQHCGRVTGVLRDEEGNPLAGENVSASSGAMRLSCPDAWAETDAAGRFVLEGLTPGPVAIEFLAEPLEVDPGGEHSVELVASAGTDSSR